MTAADAILRISCEPKTPLHSLDLFGFELISADINPASAVDCITLLHMLADMRGQTGGRAIIHRIAESKTGTLTLWTLPHEL